ncbi:hypothetical protein ACFVIM_34035 [Streptomyces sp. NPDC057638]|uniref:hypothetical protein n=1 Tax=Streptomyces sp. NPDC057638 TaxID=3346190 RepID=UPI00367B4864
MAAVIAETPLIPFWPTAEEVETIRCERCPADSGQPDDADAGAWAAHEGGWHVSDFNRDTCGCPHLCAECTHDACGTVDDSPRLIGMRVVG